MQKQGLKSAASEFQAIIEGLPERKIKLILTYANHVKQESLFPSKTLSTEEMLALAQKRARQLKKQPRPIVEARYQALLDALESEVKSKGIQVEEFSDAD